MTSRIRFQSKAEARFTGALWISTAAWRPDARNFSQQKNFQPFLKLCFWRLLLILPHKVTQTPDMRQLQGEPSSKPQIFIQRRRVPKGVPMRLCQPILPAALRANRTPAMIRQTYTLCREVRSTGRQHRGGELLNASPALSDHAKQFPNPKRQAADFLATPTIPTMRPPLLHGSSVKLI